jgi:hypothetical protein
MAYAYGNLEERLPGAKFRFILDGTVISAQTIGKSVKPADVAFTDDYSIGKIGNAKYTPKTKDRTREWSREDGLGWVERNEKIVVEDAHQITVIEFPSALYDRLAFGLAAAPVADTAQQAYATSDRGLSGWAQFTLMKQDGTVTGVLTLHIRLELETTPEIKNEYGSPVWRIVHLKDASPVSLDTYKPYPAAA